MKGDLNCVCILLKISRCPKVIFDLPWCGSDPCLSMPTHPQLSLSDRACTRPRLRFPELVLLWGLYVVTGKKTYSCLSPVHTFLWTQTWQPYAQVITTWSCCSFIPLRILNVLSQWRSLFLTQTQWSCWVLQRVTNCPVLSQTQVFHLKWVGHPVL